MNFGLERSRKLLDLLDKPDERMKIIHVAGTNGKGSVCAYISNVLKACGCTVGRFNSPHLIEPRDSFNVNGQAVSQTLYDQASECVAKLNKDVGASSFECLVATAFYLFSQARVEFVVLEVGLGGRDDATNVIRPILSIITPIGLDHVKILGNTIEEIASAKAGIMKPGCPVIISPQEEESALSTLVTCAKEIGCPYTLATPSECTDSSIPSTHSVEVGPIQYKYHICLNGDYQRVNSATAVVALDLLYRLNYISLTPELLLTGMESTSWPGRLHWIDSTITPQLKKFRLDRLLVDGAHNLPASAALYSYIESLTKNRVIWIIGATVEKDIEAMLYQLVQPGDALIAVPFSQPEGMPWINCANPSHIVDQVKNAKETFSCETLSEGLERAGRAYNMGDLVVLCGSLYLAADFYRLIS
ncbi:Mur ligase [Sporodiniella umbellata]|nr:Mur ligase [Sporodiniella umbellata]